MSNDDPLRHPPEGWIEMRLRGLIVDPNTDAPVVILREEGGSLYLPIWIGVFEANAIALVVERVETRRPLTHDLLRSILAALGGELARVEIHALIEGTFHARLVLRAADGSERVVDARPSDALALALRTGSPIWTARLVLDEALAKARAHTADTDEALKEWLENVRPEELGKYEM
ncbi:MAG: bifunctional nuclease family protein [Thermoanaerobaculia bacterium]|jgi:bifunctional DNase/RNase|nr:MAG: bifunctional nuclease family protein [Thermoanaerobaculia bacterium]MBZ0101538.1 bifunctional nuclease family protein [Thermoanaerobaculia bacterium]